MVIVKEVLEPVRLPLDDNGDQLILQVRVQLKVELILDNQVVATHEVVVHSPLPVVDLFHREVARALHLIVVQEVPLKLLLRVLQLVLGRDLLLDRQ